MGSALLVPVVTRWNSLYDAVVRLLQHEANLDRVCDAVSVPRLSSIDLIYLKEYKALMAPICSTLDFLQSEKNMLYGYLLPSLVSLSVKLKKHNHNQELIYLSTVANDLEEKLRARFANFLSSTKRRKKLWWQQFFCLM